MRRGRELRLRRRGAGARPEQRRATTAAATAKTAPTRKATW